MPEGSIPLSGSLLGPFPAARGGLRTVFDVFAAFRVYVALAALAAAFASCLCARTFASDSGPVMSAADR